MTYSPSRGRMKRKWAVDKSGGPQLFFAELVLKKLIQHCWPARIIDYGHTVTFYPIKGRTIGPDFEDALQTAVRILAEKHRVKYTCYARGLRLKGDYILTEKGQIKCVSKVSTLDKPKHA